VIDIDPLAGELGYVRAHNGEIRIGAMTRHRDLLESPLLHEMLAIFTDAERVIADPLVRNRGTIGGALCQADPSEDLSAVCAAVDAKLVIRGAERSGDERSARGSGERVIGMNAFHKGPYETAVGPAEMLVEIRVPVPPRAGSAYEKLDRRVGDWAVAAAGAALELASDGTIAGGRVALAAVGGDIVSPVSLEGRKPSDFPEASAEAAAACDPVTDQRGSKEYKRHVAGVLTERALTRAYARATEHEEEG
jgi:carbon-monoxide dehydrogenase medium subunit